MGELSINACGDSRVRFKKQEGLKVILANMTLVM